MNVSKRVGGASEQEKLLRDSEREGGGLVLVFYEMFLPALRLDGQDKYEILIPQ